MLRTRKHPHATCFAGIGPQPGSADHAAARLRAATRHYEQHVIAWHALGRLSEARAARDAIAQLPAEAGRKLHQPRIHPLNIRPRPLTKTRGAGSPTHHQTGPMAPHPPVDGLAHRDFTAVTT